MAPRQIRGTPDRLAVQDIEVGGKFSVAEVTIDHIEKQYGAFHGMKGISLHISDGEFVVLVGPSGCGKSTLLRMVAGLEYISSGDISIGDRIVNDLEPKQWDIAMVFHNCVLYPHKTVARNMGFSLTMSGVPKNELKRKVDEAARIPGLEALLDRRPKQLSGGQGQRVAMGRAIVRDPQVFLFDEPLSNLDARLRVQMRAEIKELHQRPGTTTIYVTRDQVEAMPMADKVVVMRSGILEQQGTPLGSVANISLCRYWPLDGHDYAARPARLAPLSSMAMRSGIPLVAIARLKNLRAAAVSRRAESMKSGVWPSRSTARQRSVHRREP